MSGTVRGLTFRHIGRRDEMFADPRISGPVIAAPTEAPLPEWAREAMQHVAWAREDLAKGDQRAAMMNIIAGNRLHAMSQEHGAPVWERVSDALRAVQRDFWRPVVARVARALSTPKVTSCSGCGAALGGHPVTPPVYCGACANRHITNEFDDCVSWCRACQLSEVQRG